MKITTVVLSVCVGCLSFAGVSAAVSIAPTDSNIQYMGRWNFSDSSEPWVGWKGSTVKVKFNGTEITGEFDAGSSNEQYRIIIDGVANAGTTTFSSSRDTYTLASGLSDSEHTVEVMKETFINNNTTFYGFEITGSSPAILPLPPKPSLRIEYFGDSNMDGSSLYSERNSGGHGTYYAFPAVVSRMLNVEHNDQSVSGARLDGSGDNTVRSFIFSQDYYNQGYTPTFNPHVIVINAGANDVGAGKTTIKDRYKACITDLRSVYGAGPHIVLFNSYGWDPDEPANYSHEVISELAPGDTNISVCLFPWMWEKWHGSMIEHAGEANILADHIVSLGLGFTKVQESELFDSFGRNFNVANGSFEGAGIGSFGAFGWRYYDDSGVSRIHDSAVAPDGEYYLQLTAGGGGNSGSVMQGTDATGDFLPGPTTSTQDYYLTLMMKGTPGAQAEISTKYQVQEVYSYTGTPVVQNVSVTTSWKRYSVHLTAPSGVWQTFIRLRAVSGTVDFDNIRMSDSTDPDFSFDLDDLNEMAGDWLSDDAQWDIAPWPEGDDIVNIKDFALLTDFWEY